jgi:hypothetical protein
MEEQLYNLGQKVYLVLNGVYNDVAGTERTGFVDETIDWTNQYLDELAMEADWSWLRKNDELLGTIEATDTQLTLAPTVLRLVSDWQRSVVMTKPNGERTIWAFVKPNQIYNTTERGIQQDRVALVGRTLQFSRPFRADEINATVRADVITKFTPISRTNIDSLELVQPQQLIVLGVAKNQVLPDVVNNTLTANYDLKYSRLLTRAINLDGASSELDELMTDDLSFIGGIY